MNELIPRWLIDARTRPGGARFPQPKAKFKQVGFGFTPMANVKRSRGVSMIKTVFSSLRGNTDFPKFPNFDLAEYRFWQVEKSEGRVVASTCRSCGSVVISADYRKVHQERMGCAGKLVQAYKLLGRDKVCVVCDNPTKNEKWGIPLCSAECVSDWCFTVARPPSLIQAMGVLERKQ